MIAASFVMCALVSFGSANSQIRTVEKSFNFELRQHPCVNVIGGGYERGRKCSDCRVSLGFKSSTAGTCPLGGNNGGGGTDTNW